MTKKPTAKKPAAKKFTVIDALELLPSPYKELAIYNANKQKVGGLTVNSKEKNTSILYALEYIVPEDTEQGEEFWNGLFNAIECRDKYPEIPDGTKKRVICDILECNVILHKDEGLTYDGDNCSPEEAVKLAKQIIEFFEQ